ncbi:hypothetical protein BJ912DRAFT_1021592 [Pholiota molesta]|nr:hypothetical protein BJ912DRAFT_1021592 [Pholiota molesta]
MQPPPNGLRGYSDFFASGFRAVTPHRGSSRRYSTDASISTASSSRRARPTSMIVQPTAPKTRGSKRHDSSRRSSFVTFSSRLFDRMTFSYADENSANMFSSSSQRSDSTSARSRLSRFFTSTDDSDELHPDVWITTGGPHTPSAPNGSAALHLQSIDPFTSSPDARSMFIDLSSDSSPIGTPKRESFLSLTNSRSSSARSSLLFGTRRERPTSTHTAPLPSRSRQGVAPLNGPEKYDFAWITEELEEPSTVEPIVEDQEWDAPAKIDWHQFHIDILTNDPTQ